MSNVTASHYFINYLTTSTTSINYYPNSSANTVIDNPTYYWNLPEDKKLQPGTVHKLPDGSKVMIDFNGNYEIVDKNAVVTYKSSNIREFNKFVNASDLLESFIRDIGKLGVCQKDIFSIPIGLFIDWLIIKAAEKDGEVVNYTFKEKVVKYLN